MKRLKLRETPKAILQTIVVLGIIFLALATLNSIGQANKPKEGVITNCKEENFNPVYQNDGTWYITCNEGVK